MAKERKAPASDTMQRWGDADRREENAPPVPPKDTPKHATMDTGSAPPSASKRKRADTDHDDTTYDLRNGRLEPADLDAHTPKRSRQSDTEGSESTPVGQRGLRRKKKVNNLSNLNLRHDAEQQRVRESQAAEQQRARESRFQEGSLTDKPSMKPPSAFTRMVRTESGNIKQVDELMEGYNDDEPLPDVSASGSHHGEEGTQRFSTTTEAAPKAESGGLFRFGRPFAALSGFHPVTLWNKMWNESREELIRQHNEEEARKRRQKEEAELKYAQMKAAGQLGLKHVSNGGLPGVRKSDESARPRDSAVVLDGVRESADHKRTTSTGSQLVPPPKDDFSSHSGSEAQEGPSKAKGTFRSRFAFKKPSVSNLKGGLKRVASDLNLTSASPTGNGESSSSVSPTKQDFEPSTLKRSASKFDLKMQHKLSKRVSDLETKLQIARSELNEALVQASPAPKFSGKYERFRSTSGMGTLKRPKFVPGGLPSLPSERVLLAEQLGFGDGDDELSPDKDEFEAQVTAKSNELSERIGLDGGEGDVTMEAGTSRQYPRRADSLFKLSDDKIDLLPNANGNTTANTIDKAQADTNEHTEEMNPYSITNLTTDGPPAPALANGGDYASLDAKLKALDKQVKATSKKKPASKKRKSGTKDDGLFKPTTTTDDELEFEGTLGKKRKSTGGAAASSPPGPAAKRTRGGSAAGKQSPPKKTAKGAKRNSKPVVAEADSPEPAAGGGEEYSDADGTDGQGGAAEIDEVPARTSMDSQGQPLEPLYEAEEEETAAIAPVNGDPAKRMRYFGTRSRSGSPHKHSRAGSVQPAAEEMMIMRAAEAAQGRRGRSASPGPGRMLNKTTEVVERVITDFQNVTPPTSAEAGVERSVVTKTTTTVEMKIATGAAVEEGFEWPEDVF